MQALWPAPPLASAHAPAIKQPPRTRVARARAPLQCSRAEGAAADFSPLRCPAAPDATMADPAPDPVTAAAMLSSNGPSHQRQPLSGITLSLSLPVVPSDSSYTLTVMHMYATRVLAAVGGTLAGDLSGAGSAHRRRSSAYHAITGARSPAALHPVARQNISQCLWTPERASSVQAAADAAAAALPAGPAALRIVTLPRSARGQVLGALQAALRLSQHGGAGTADRHAPRAADQEQAQHDASRQTTAAGVVDDDLEVLGDGRYRVTPSATTALLVLAFVIEPQCTGGGGGCRVAWGLEAAASSREMAGRLNHHAAREAAVQPDRACAPEAGRGAAAADPFGGTGGSIAAVPTDAAGSGLPRLAFSAATVPAANSVVAPVSRAYWKMRQVLDEHLDAPGSFGSGWWPTARDRGGTGVDLGASPGGWTQALRERGHLDRMLAIDKGLVSARVSGLGGVAYGALNFTSPEAAAAIAAAAPLSCVVCDANIHPQDVVSMVLATLARAALLLPRADAEPCLPAAASTEGHGVAGAHGEGDGGGGPAISTPTPQSVATHAAVPPARATVDAKEHRPGQGREAALALAIEAAGLARAAEATGHGLARLLAPSCALVLTLKFPYKTVSSVERNVALQLQTLPSQLRAMAGLAPDDPDVPFKVAYLFANSESERTVLAHIGGSSRARE